MATKTTPADVAKRITAIADALDLTDFYKVVIVGDNVEVQIEGDTFRSFAGNTFASVTEAAVMLADLATDMDTGEECADCGCTDEEPHADWCPMSTEDEG